LRESLSPTPMFNDIAPADQTRTLIERARDLAPTIRSCRDQVDAARQIPERLVCELRTAGMFRLLVPAELGGYELDPITFAKIIEEIAAVDGATGWVVSVGAVGGLFAGYMDRGTAREIYGTDSDAIVAGGINPSGKAVAVDGGYVVSGQWGFGSGIQHASWVYGNCVVHDGDRPRLNEAGAPELRVMLFPATECQIQDTWHTGGLRGTGSHDFRVHDIFVPAERSLTAFAGAATQQGLLYKYPFSLFAVLIAAVPLGIARGAIAALIDLARAKKPTGSQVLLRERPSAQEAVARAEAMYRSGRAFLFEAIESMKDEIGRTGRASMKTRLDLRLACTQAAQNSVNAVDLMSNTGGATSIYSTSLLERAFRDVHTAIQHIAVTPMSFELSGRVLFGLDPGTSRF
jgi:indole-3-acetate monooxygenase